ACLLVAGCAGAPQAASTDARARAASARKPAALAWRPEPASVSYRSTISEDVLCDIRDDAVAVAALQADGVRRRHEELRPDRLVVRHAVGIGALHEAAHLLGKLHAVLARDLVLADDVDRRVGRDEGDLVDLGGIELAVLDLEDVLAA